MPKQDERPHFEGYTKPAYTMVPDQLIDDQMYLLTGAELKVLLYICRRTFGFKKDDDAISLSQITDGIVTRDGKRLDHGTGLSRRATIEALRNLEEMGLILAVHSGVAGSHKPTIYRLNITGQSPLELVTKNNQTGNETKPVLVQKSNPQKTVQKTVKQKGRASPQKRIPTIDEQVAEFERKGQAHLFKG